MRINEPYKILVIAIACIIVAFLAFKWYNDNAVRMSILNYMPDVIYYVHLANNMSHPLDTVWREPVCIWPYIFCERWGNLDPTMISLIFQLFAIPFIYLSFKRLTPSIAEIALLVLVTNMFFVRYSLWQTRDAQVMFLFWAAIYFWLKGSNWRLLFVLLLVYSKFPFIVAAPLLLTGTNCKRLLIIFTATIGALSIYYLIAQGEICPFIQSNNHPDWMHKYLPHPDLKSIVGSAFGFYDFWFGFTIKAKFFTWERVFLYPFYVLGFGYTLISMLIYKKKQYWLLAVHLLASFQLFYILHAMLIDHIQWDSRYFLPHYPYFAYLSVYGIYIVITYQLRRKEDE